MHVSIRHEMPMGHRLSRYPGNCRNLHGHNYIIEATVDGPVEPRSGFVYDFGYLKQELRKYFELWDHAMVLNSADRLVDRLTAETRLVLLRDTEPTAENLARVWLRDLRQAIPELYSLTVYETERCSVHLEGDLACDILVEHIV